MNLTALGQSGFVIDDQYRTIIDPFLGPLEDPVDAAQFPRLVAPPIDARDLQRVETVLISHHHGDHCHIGTLQAIAANSPDCMFVAPLSVRERLTACGIDGARVITPALPGWVSHGRSRTCVLPAAHYGFSSRLDATFDFFGFVVETSAGRIYSAGDTIPYSGQAALVRKIGCRIAILPVNGRDQERERLGIIGNMDAHEAATLASTAGVEWIIPCHTGMFAANTVDERLIEAVLRDECPAAQIWQPTIGSSKTF